MAGVIPFRGILYNQLKIKNFSDVTTPPFDVISKRQQDRFYDISPYNPVRLILGKKTAFDTRTNNPHTRAAEYLNLWLAERVLVRDNQPALYFTSVEFDLYGRRIKRHGLIACARLEPFEAGVILPHEKTFTNVKTERLSLMKACHTNFSPIFSLYADKRGVVSQLNDSLSGKAPDLAFADSQGCIHNLWRVIDPDLHRFVSDAFATRRLYIADGHHRYETALNYRNWLAETTPDFSDRHPANYVLTYLCSLSDPGLTILPAHRLIRQVPKENLAELIARAGQYFHIQRFDYREDQRSKVLDRFLIELGANARQRSIGVVIRAKKAFYLLTLREEAVLRRHDRDEIAVPLWELDVTILTQLIFIEVLGFDQARLDNEKLIDYTVNAAEAAEAVQNRQADAAFLLNPTHVENVCRIAQQGLVMPRKATYFYPKVTTGLVFNLLED
jgi:uncharacterized protein (DUF1015 family)